LFIANPEFKYVSILFNVLSKKYSVYGHVFFAGTKWLGWHLGNQKSVLGRIDFKPRQSDRENSQLSWAFLEYFYLNQKLCKSQQWLWASLGVKTLKFKGVNVIIHIWGNLASQ
jgi:hypothetical protein